MNLSGEGLISDRIAAVQSPVIPEVADLIDANPGTIPLGQGVVFYPPPENILSGIERFIKSASHHYQPVEGNEELRSAFGEKLKHENGIDASRFSIVVSAGSNMGFLNAVMAIADPDDEIILLRPWYFNQEMAVRLANCVPVPVDTDELFQPRIDAVDQAITRRTRAIVTISPNNPSGAVYSPAVLHAINELCASRGIYHISDEAYEYFCYDGAEHYSPARADAGANHTITLHSTSKSLGMANWRIGFMLIPKHLFKSVRKIQDTNLICPTAISQYVAVESLKAGYRYCESKIKEIQAVRAHLQRELGKLPAVAHSPLQGAFYALLELPDESMDDMAIVRQLIERHGVAVIPGNAFGIEDKCCLRVSYGALEPSEAVTGIDRLIGGLQSILAQ